MSQESDLSSIPLTYVLNNLYSERNYFKLDPSVLKKSRVILAFESQWVRERAVLSAALLKVIQTGSNVWVLVNTRKESVDLQLTFNNLIPYVARIERFGYRDPSAEFQPKIVLSTYPRFLNQFLELRVTGIKALVFYHFDAEMHSHVKEVLLGQVLKLKPTYHLLWVYERMRLSHEVVQCRLQIIEPGQDTDRGFVIESKSRENIDQWVAKSEEPHPFTDLRDLDYFILGNCYRKAITKRTLRLLLKGSQLGVLRALGNVPDPTLRDDFEELIENSIQQLKKRDLIKTPQRYYYKTTEFGKALVRYGIRNIRDHDKIIEIIQKYGKVLRDNYKLFDHYIRGVLISLPDHLHDAFKKLQSDLTSCSQEIRIFDPFFTGLLVNVYLRLPFHRPEKRKERAEQIQQGMIQNGKEVFMKYVRKKPDPKISHLDNFKQVIDEYMAHLLDVFNFLFSCIMIKCRPLPVQKSTVKIILKDLEKDGHLERKYFQNKRNRELYVLLHHPRTFWGPKRCRLPKSTCSKCHFFTDDQLCGFWRAVKREDPKKLPVQLEPRTMKSYNPKAYSCPAFHPLVERRKPLLEKGLVLSLRKRIEESEPSLLSASFFSEFRRCPTSAILSYFHVSPSNRQMRAGTELHRMFQLFNRKLVRKFQKSKGRITWEGIAIELNQIKKECLQRDLEYLEKDEVEEFLKAFIQKLITKIKVSPKKIFTFQEVLIVAFGGMLHVEEPVKGNTIKGRGDLVIYSRTESRREVQILDLKSSGPYPHQELELAALAIAIEEQEQLRGNSVEMKKLVILTKDMKEHEFPLTQALRDEIQEIKDAFEELKNDPNKLKEFPLGGAKVCPKQNCEKRQFCTLDTLMNFQFNREHGYRCLICSERFEQLENHKGEFSHAPMQCGKCRTTYKRKRVHAQNFVVVDPDQDHVLLEKAEQVANLSLPSLAPYRRRAVKMISPGVKFDETILAQGFFPIRETPDEEHEPLGNIETIIDKQDPPAISPACEKFLREKFEIAVVRDELTTKLSQIHRFYDEVVNIIRKTEGFPKTLILSNIESRFTLSLLVLDHFLKKTFDKTEQFEREKIKCWTILDQYLLSLSTNDMDALRGLEGAAAVPMWDLIKSYFEGYWVPINSRVLSRRVHDQYWFSSIKTAAKTKGNALINYYFIKCTELARLVHEQQLLGWKGTAGMYHGRKRKTALDEMGLVVDLNENFKLLYLLALIKALAKQELDGGDLSFWIGSRRQANYFLKKQTIEAVNQACGNIWENGYLREFGLNSTVFNIREGSLESVYRDFLSAFKDRCVLLYQQLLQNTVNGKSYLHYMISDDGIEQNIEISKKIKRFCREFIMKNFRPFTIKAQKYLDMTIDQEKLEFFQEWARALAH